MKTKVFAEGFCFTKVFIFFVLGCLLGTYYEEILWFVRTKEKVNRQGMIYGPFSPIYGFGVVIFVAILGLHNADRSILRTWIYGCLIGGGAEYTMSLIADRVFGVKFWDYHGMFLNINGRTTVPFMLAWGVFGTVLMKAIYPFVSKLIEKIPYKIGQPLYILLLIFIVFDLFVTYGSLGRAALRKSGKPAYTVVGRLFDQYYDDEFLAEKFPIMMGADEEGVPGETNRKTKDVSGETETKSKAQDAAEEADTES